MTSSNTSGITTWIKASDAPAALRLRELLPGQTILLARSNTRQDEPREPVTNCCKAMHRHQRNRALRVTNYIATGAMPRRQRVCSCPPATRWHCTKPSSPSEEESHAWTAELADQRRAYAWKTFSHLAPRNSRETFASAPLRPREIGPDLRSD